VDKDPDTKVLKEKMKGSHSKSLSVLPPRSSGELKSLQRGKRSAKASTKAIGKNGNFANKERERTGRRERNAFAHGGSPGGEEIVKGGLSKKKKEKTGSNKGRRQETLLFYENVKLGEARGMPAGRLNACRNQ